MSNNQRTVYQWKTVLDLNETYIQARQDIQPAIAAMVNSATPENQAVIGPAGHRMLNELINLDNDYAEIVRPHVETHVALQEVTVDEIQVFMNCFTSLRAYAQTIAGMVGQINFYVGGEEQ